MSRQQIRKQEKQNILMSAFYDYVGEYHIDNICADINSLEEDINSLEFPETLDDWFNEYSKKAKKAENQSRMKRKMRSVASRAAVIVTALLISLITLTLSVGAFRAQVYNLLFTDYEEYSNVKIRKEPVEDIKLIEWENYYFPTYLPADFYIESANDAGDIKLIKFTNKGDKYINFTQAPNGTDISLDTEEGEKKEVMIKNRKAFLTEKEGRNILFWNDEEFSFNLASNLDVEKLLFIAESLEKK